MKKVISIMLVFSMLLSFASVSLAAEPTSQVLESTNIVNVTGQLEEGGDYVNVLLLDNSNNVKYINEFPVEADGSYRAKFKYNGDIKGLSLQVKQGLSDVTDSVVSAITEDEAVVYTLDVVNSPVNSEVKAQIENYYNVTGKTYKVILAYYGENNRLLDVVMENTKNIGEDLTIHQEDYKIPDDAKKIKVFMWNDEKNMIPLAESVEGKKNDTIRVLAIGNSFAVDAFDYLDDIARNGNVNLDLRIAQIGGSTFTTHYTAWVAEGEAGNVYTENGVACNIDHFLEDGSRYDYITIQQNCANSGLKDEYIKGGEELVKYIREKQPTAEILIHQTWACEKGSTVGVFVNNYGQDQAVMHAGILEAVNNARTELAKVETDSGLKVSLDGKPLRYIPAGEAFEIARQNENFNTTYTGQNGSNNLPQLSPIGTVSLYRDSYHASFNYGRYLIALVWYACLTGNSVIDNTTSSNYSQYPIDEELRPIINAAAQKAVDDSGIWN